MNLIIVGMEYAGKTTLADEIIKWRNDVMGKPSPLGIVEYHDHFTFPWLGHWDEISEEDMATFMSLGPQLKEMFSRYQFAYHLSDQLYRDSDHILLGFHIEDAIFAPRYYGFGKKGEYGDRSNGVRAVEMEIMEKAPETVLVHMKATPEVIRERMRTSPHTRTHLKDEHIDEMIEEFEYHFSHSLLRNRIVLDTSEATIEETIAQFVESMGPLMSHEDRVRMQAHATLKAAKGS